MTTLAKSRSSGRRFAKVRLQRLRTPTAPGVAAGLHLSLLGGLLAAAVFADGGTVPQAWLVCQVAVGLLLISSTAITKPARAAAPPARGFPAAVLLLPLYATVQAFPLPLRLVRWLSPARAELHDSIANLLPEIPPWTPLSVDPAATLDFALRLAAYAAVYWIVRGLSARFGRNSFAVTAPVVLVAVVESGIALLQNLAGKPATGSYVNRNHLAGLLEMALPFAVVPAISLLSAVSTPAISVPALPLGRSRGKSPRPLAAAAGATLTGAGAVLILAAILASRSRGGLVAALVSLLVLGLAALKRSALPRKKWLLAAALAALLATAFLYLPSENLVRRYTHLLGRDALRHEGRVSLWSETLDLVAAYPLVGCGFGGFEAAFLGYKRSAPMVTDTHAHNDYLELLAEGGVLAFALCVALAAPPIAALVRASVRSESGRDSVMSLACLASIAAILAHSFVDFNLRIPANGMAFFWVLGLCSAGGHRPCAKPVASRQGERRPST
jgi:O-antigen ligase